MCACSGARAEVPDGALSSQFIPVIPAATPERPEGYVRREGKLAAPRTPNYNYSDARKPRHVAQNPPLTATAKCWEVWPACRAR